MIFKHSGNLGDVIYSLPTVISLTDHTRGLFLLEPDQPAKYRIATRHPSGNVRLTAENAEKLIPLLKSQPYLSEARIYADEKLDIDLDDMRETGFDLGKGNICRWYFYAFKANYDLSQPWLWAKPSPDTANLILINRTQRYKNPHINYRFLRNRKDVVYVGLPSEYEAFTRYNQCRIPYRQAEDFKQLAEWIAGSKLFIGNQSFCYSIAEGLKVNRILEISPVCPNVQPGGLKGWDVWNQALFEEIFFSIVDT